MTLSRFLVAVLSLPIVSAAQDDIQRVKELVDAGVVPRKRLEEAQAHLEEARDQEILKATLYGKVGLEDMTEQQSQSMLAAAKRQWDRQRDRLREAEKLVDAGVKSPTSLVPFLEEFDRGRRVFDSAERRARLFKELAEMVKSEQELVESALEPAAPQDKFEGDGLFLNVHLASVEYAFKREFGKALPVSASGETELHRSLGFDHRGRVDVGIYPDSNEGLWLRRYLEFLKVPYISFRGRVRGQATAAHIHIGPPSMRIRRAD